MRIASLIEVPARRLSPGMELLDEDGAVVEVVRAKLQRRFGFGIQVVRVWLRDRNGKRTDGWVHPDDLIPIVSR